jgi:Leucine-rich repeat (LRR) protein
MPTENLRVIVKRTPLRFVNNVKGQGMVELIEEAPVQALVEAASGRHFAKRYFIRIENFKVFPGMLAMSDDPLYLYVFREKISRSQANFDWKIQDGKLRSSNSVLARLSDTSDAELIMFDKGLGGSLRGGEAERDNFITAMRRTPIADLLARGDELAGSKIRLPGSKLVRHLPTFLSEELLTAAHLMGDDGDDVIDENDVPIDDWTLRQAPFSFSDAEIANLHQAMHDVRVKSKGHATFEQEIMSVDAEEIVSVMVIQPPDIKPMRGTVSVAAYGNFRACRLMENVLELEKEAERRRLSGPLQLEAGNNSGGGSKSGGLLKLSGGGRSSGSTSSQTNNNNGNKNETELGRIGRELLARAQLVKRHQRAVKARLKEADKAAKAREKQAQQAREAKAKAVEEEEEEENAKLLGTLKSNDPSSSMDGSRVGGGGASGEGGGGGQGGQQQQQQPHDRNTDGKAAFKFPAIEDAAGGGSGGGVGGKVVAVVPDNARSGNGVGGGGGGGGAAAAVGFFNGGKGMLAAALETTGGMAGGMADMATGVGLSGMAGGKKKRLATPANRLGQQLFSLSNVEDAQAFAKRLMRAELEGRRQLWRLDKGLDPAEPITAGAVAKFGREPKKVKRVSAALFDDLLRVHCGVVCFQTRSLRVHEAVCSSYNLGAEGLDYDSLGVALLLCCRYPALEGSPSFLTPLDAFEAFDRNRDGLVDQGEYEAAIKCLVPWAAMGDVADAFVTHCDGEGHLSPLGLASAFVDLCDAKKELHRRRKQTRTAGIADGSSSSPGKAAVTTTRGGGGKVDGSGGGSSKGIAASLLGAFRGGVASAAGFGPSLQDRLDEALVQEAMGMRQSAFRALAAIKDEERVRSEAVQAARWEALEESVAAAVEVRRDAAVAYKEESGLRDKREKEAKLVARQRLTLKMRVRKEKEERKALVLKTEIDMRKEERERREALRAACGADVLQLTGLGMHKLSDYMDPTQVGKNGMRGVKPKPNVALSHLVEFDVSRNNLHGALDDKVLFQLSALLKFDACHNRLTSAEGLHQLTGCKIMRLSHNRLGPSLPRMLGDPTGLANLETLSVDNNALETLPDTFGGLKSLRRLAAFNNKFTRLPDFGCLGPLTSLLELRLRHNHLVALPADMGGMASLQVLDLAYNALHDLPSCMAGLKSLRFLNMSFNKLDAIDESALRGMTSLQVLELDHNLLVGRAPRSLGHLPLLNRLDLSFNGYESLSGGDDAFQRNAQLECMDISHNKIGSLPAELGKLERLHTLNANCNVLESLPAEMGSLQALHVLKLRTNKLPLLPPEMACLSSLQSLDLAENQLVRLPPSFSTLVSLTTLDMSHNRIKSPIPSSLGLIPNLEKLQLQGNQITSLPETLGYLRCLKALDVSNNVISSLPDSVSLLRRLTVLDLRRNSLRALPVGLGTLADLRTVEVGANPLDELPRNFVDPTSDEVIGWVRREHVFNGAAVKEWEAHEQEYSVGALGLHHFLENVALQLSPDHAKLVAPQTAKRPRGEVEAEKKALKDAQAEAAEEAGNTGTVAKPPKPSSSSSSVSSAVSGASGGSGDDNASMSTAGNSSSSDGSMAAYHAKKRFEAEKAAFAKQNANLKDQVVSFFFKAKSRGVVPQYSSVSLNEQAERSDVLNLTRARRLKRAALAAAEEKELFAEVFDDEVRRFEVMFNHEEEAEGSAALELEEEEGDKAEEEVGDDSYHAHDHFHHQKGGHKHEEQFQVLSLRGPSHNSDDHQWA